MAIGVAEIGGRGKAELRRHLFYAERPVRLQETPCRVHLEVVYVALRTHSELFAEHLANGDMRKADMRHYVRRRERAVKRRVDEAKRLRMISIALQSQKKSLRQKQGLRIKPQAPVFALCRRPYATVPITCRVPPFM